jgi:hypothetical protein
MKQLSEQGGYLPWKCSPNLCGRSLKIREILQPYDTTPQWDR